MRARHQTVINLVFLIAALLYLLTFSCSSAFSGQVKSNRAESQETNNIKHAGEIRFNAEVMPLSEEMKNKMNGVTFRPGCPVPLSDLVLIRVDYHGFDHKIHHGQLVVHKKVGPELIEIFRDIFNAGFPIDKIKPASDYNGNDDASMADDNTSAFNCRPVTGGKRFSAHAYGLAIDINPMLNPYIKGKIVEPQNGKIYSNRRLKRPGMIRKPGPVYKAFTSRGWKWGGSWHTLKDYQHFEFPLENLASKLE
ncbi:MAG: M15 family metallopeptidase [Deltaproteobacteria bacterium]|nr:M15 family metallopeptidase [Deltaproteobacteria bacterium]